jgi:hypothetical protein
MKLITFSYYVTSVILANDNLESQIRGLCPHHSRQANGLGEAQRGNILVTQHRNTPDFKLKIQNACNLR